MVRLGELSSTYLCFMYKTLGFLPDVSFFYTNYFHLWLSEFSPVVYFCDVNFHCSWGSFTSFDFSHIKLIDLIVLFYSKLTIFILLISKIILLPFVNWSIGIESPSPSLLITSLCLNSLVHFVLFHTLFYKIFRLIGLESYFRNKSPRRSFCIKF